MSERESESARESRPVSDTQLAEALAPYRPGSRYLVAAQIMTRGPGQRAEITGRFAIESPCYIAATGHFNSVEFNLCHAQLARVLLRDARVRSLLPQLASGFDAIRVRNLASVFRRGMSSTAFSGRLAILRTGRQGRVVSIDTEVRFWAPAGGHCEGTATLEVRVA